MSGIDLIQKYFPDLTDQQKNQYARLGDLYGYWNEQINVISRKDIGFLFERHVLHSLAISKVIQFKDGSRILDVGTGGGFPGIPLAIMFPKCHFHLVDSIGKKIKVVKEISHELQLKNVTAAHCRAEDVKDTYDFIVSRAVTRLNTFVGWVRKKTRTENKNALSNGILYLKGGDISEELAEVKLEKQLFNLSDYFDEVFFETKKVVWVRIK